MCIRDSTYAAFLRLLARSTEELPRRIGTYCWIHRLKESFRSTCSPRSDIRKLSPQWGLPRGGRGEDRGRSVGKQKRRDGRNRRRHASALRKMLSILTKEGPDLPRPSASRPARRKRTIPCPEHRDSVEEWRQGDYFLGTSWFVYRFDPSAPLASQSRDLADPRVDLCEIEVKGFVLLTQSCDVVRDPLKRPFLQVAPLVEVDEIRLQQIKHERRPQYVFVPDLEDSRLVGDLDRVMTVEKPVALGGIEAGAAGQVTSVGASRLPLHARVRDLPFQITSLLWSKTWSTGSRKNTTRKVMKGVPCGLWWRSVLL